LQNFTDDYAEEINYTNELALEYDAILDEESKKRFG